MMSQLPEPVSDNEISEMFNFADKDADGKLSYAEFQIMIDPPAPPIIPKPSISDIGLPPQVNKKEDGIWS